MAPRCAVVGHVTWDLVGRGARIGGTAAYGAVTALRLGWKVGLVTSVGPDWDVLQHLPGVDARVVPALHTTVFRNTYRQGRRFQRLYSVASPLESDHIPPEWRRAPVVLLGPVAQEVEPSVVLAFPGALRGAVLQGWLRRWSPHGRILPLPSDPEGLRGYLDVAVVSQEEVPSDEWLRRLRACVPIVATTAGVAGSTLYLARRTYAIPAFPTEEVDPTGAGDVYAAAFLLRYYEAKDPLAAALFASAAASFSVEAPGVTGVPTREQVETRLQQMKGVPAVIA